MESRLGAARGAINVGFASLEEVTRQDSDDSDDDFPERHRASRLRKAEAVTNTSLRFCYSAIEDCRCIGFDLGK